jgi:hypothetical protein
MYVKLRRRSLNLKFYFTPGTRKKISNNTLNASKYNGKKSSHFLIDD